MKQKVEVLIDGSVFEKTNQIGIWRLFYETMCRNSQDVEYRILLSQKPRQPLPEGCKPFTHPHAVEEVASMF